MREVRRSWGEGGGQRSLGSRRAGERARGRIETDGSLSTLFFDGEANSSYFCSITKNMSTHTFARFIDSDSLTPSQASTKLT